MAKAHEDGDKEEEPAETPDLDKPEEDIPDNELVNMEELIDEHGLRPRLTYSAKMQQSDVDMARIRN